MSNIQDPSEEVKSRQIQQQKKIKKAPPVLTELDDKKI
jgi:hypothetical protein